MGREESGQLLYGDYCRIIDEYSGCMDDYPYVFDIANDRYYISQKALARFSMSQNEFTHVVDRHREFVYAEDYQMLVDDLKPVSEGKKESHDIRYRWIGKNHKPIWIHCKGRLIRDEWGNPRYMIGCVNEIGERQQADNITSLRQTGVLQEQFDQGKFPMGFFMRVGLDGFKSVVERLGMEYGDRVLKDVADCIKKSLGPSQHVYRAISDEFLIVDFENYEESEAVRLYRRIRASLDFYIDAHDYEVVFTVSGGVIRTSDIKDKNYEEVMRLSRFALNMAKNKGRNQLYLFEDKEYAAFVRKTDLNAALRQSVANDFEGFEMYYQPINNAATGEIFGAESLCRFFYKGKVVSPAEFIPILEETGLIIPVGRWIMNQACMMLKECRKTHDDFRVAINLSYVQMMKSGVADDLTRVLRNLDMTAAGLAVEITESGYLEQSDVIERVLNHLRECGVRVALDDFGTGYSNMHYIDHLKPNTIKIDRSFTLEAITSDYVKILMQNLIELAHSLKMTVIVEGVETPDELVAIRKMGPDYIQGFYYGKPCNRETFMKTFI